jgi:hypothetical protein
MMSHDYKFQPGEVFVLSQKARIRWVACTLTYGQIEAVRCDSPIGKKIMAWLDAGKPKLPDGEPSAILVGVHKALLTRTVGKTFGFDDLKTAVKV